MRWFWSIITALLLVCPALAQDISRDLSVVNPHGDEITRALGRQALSPFPLFSSPGEAIGTEVVAKSSFGRYTVDILTSTAAHAQLRDLVKAMPRAVGMHDFSISERKSTYSAEYVITAFDADSTLTASKTAIPLGAINQYLQDHCPQPLGFVVLADRYRETTLEGKPLDKVTLLKPDSVAANAVLDSTCRRTAQGLGVCLLIAIALLMPIFKIIEKYFLWPKYYSLYKDRTAEELGLETFSKINRKVSISRAVSITGYLLLALAYTIPFFCQTSWINYSSEILVPSRTLRCWCSIFLLISDVAIYFGVHYHLDPNSVTLRPAANKIEARRITGFYLMVLGVAFCLIMFLFVQYRVPFMPPIKPFTSIPLTSIAIIFIGALCYPMLSSRSAAATATKSASQPINTAVTPINSEITPVNVALDDPEYQLIRDVASQFGRSLGGGVVVTPGYEPFTYNTTTHRVQYGEANRKRYNEELWKFHVTYLFTVMNSKIDETVLRVSVFAFSFAVWKLTPIFSGTVLNDSIFLGLYTWLWTDVFKFIIEKTKLAYVLLQKYPDFKLVALGVRRQLMCKIVGAQLQDPGLIPITKLRYLVEMKRLMLMATVLRIPVEKGLLERLTMEIVLNRTAPTGDGQGASGPAAQAAGGG